MRNKNAAAALIALLGFSQQSCVSDSSPVAVPGAPHAIGIVLPPGSEQIWDQQPDRLIRFWIRDPKYPLASHDIPIFSIEYRPRENREVGAPDGVQIENPRRRSEWGVPEAEFAVEARGYADFVDDQGGEYVEYRRVIRRDFSFGQINCELRSSIRKPIIVYRALLAKLCRSVQAVQND